MQFSFWACIRDRPTQSSDSVHQYTTIHVLFWSDVINTSLIFIYQICSPFQTGFEGRNCSVNINDCENDPCKNKATCEDLVNDFKCKCKDGYEGKVCDKVIERCPTCNTTGGECVQKGGNFTCQCKPNFKGKCFDVNICIYNCTLYMYNVQLYMHILTSKHLPLKFGLH